MTVRTVLGQSVRLALNAAIDLETHLDTGAENPHLKSFMSAVAEAGRVLLQVHERHPAQAKWHREDIRLLVSVAMVNLERELSHEEVQATWKMLDVLQKLYDVFPEKTKTLAPEEVVNGLKKQLIQMLEDLHEWEFYDDHFSAEDFDTKVAFINDLLQGQYESWDPRTDPLLGKLVARIQLICSFQQGDVWNDRYAEICRVCSKMSSSTFVWTADLQSELPDRTSRSAVGEEGFEDKERVERTSIA